MQRPSTKTSASTRRSRCRSPALAWMQKHARLAIFRVATLPIRHGVDLADCNPIPSLRSGVSGRIFANAITPSAMRSQVAPPGMGRPTRRERQMGAMTGPGPGSERTTPKAVASTPSRLARHCGSGCAPIGRACSSFSIERASNFRGGCCRTRNFHCPKSPQRCITRTRQCSRGRSGTGRRSVQGNGALPGLERPSDDPFESEVPLSPGRRERRCEKTAAIRRGRRIEQTAART